jgi:FtsP/CotA-like multicopper oxidase with cupredoxin domain
LQVKETLNDFKDLHKLWLKTNGATKNITLNEVSDAGGCPKQLNIAENGHVKLFSNHDVISCSKGRVEKWNFFNPTVDIHPIHLHAVHFMCGPNEYSVDNNVLKDIVAVPPGDPDEITQVCYVACTPSEFLIEDSHRKPKQFGFPTDEPYVLHCHVIDDDINDVDFGA